MLKPLILDRYIIRKFIGTYLVSLLIIAIVVIVFDISEKIEDFTREKNPPALFDIIFVYYLTFIPYIVNMFSSLFVFITVIFFTSKMAAHSEIIAILSGGMSFRRMMYPYFLSAACICIFSIVLNLFVIPPANAKRLTFEEDYIKSAFYNSNTNIHFQVGAGTFVYMETFSTSTNTATKFSIEEFADDKLISKITSDEAKWNKESKQWELSNYVKRTLLDSSEILEHGQSMNVVVDLDADDLKHRDNFTESMNYYELNSYIAQLQQRGDVSIKFALIEKQKRIAIPFSSFILTLIGVSLSSRKVRGGMGLKIGIGLALSFSYILFLRFSEMFVHADTLSPVVALWLPNILYAIVAIVLYRLAPK